MDTVPIGGVPQTACVQLARLWQPIRPCPKPNHERVVPKGVVLLLGSGLLVSIKVFRRPVESVIVIAYSNPMIGKTRGCTTIARGPRAAVGNA